MGAGPENVAQCELLPEDGAYDLYEVNVPVDLQPAVEGFNSDCLVKCLTLRGELHKFKDFAETNRGARAVSSDSFVRGMMDQRYREEVTTVTENLHAIKAVCILDKKD